MKKSPLWFAFLAVTLANGVVACGDDDDDDNGTAGSSTGGGGRGGTAGSSTGGGGRGGTTNQGGVAGKSPVGPGGEGGTSAGAPPAEGGAGGAEAGAGSGGEAGGAGAGGAGGAGGAAAETAQLTDAQILLVLDTVNQGEVEVAFAALPHLSVPAVTTFAQDMIDDHSAGRQAVIATSNDLDLKPQPSDLQQELMSQAEATVAELHESQSDALDAMYIDEEVTDHLEALQLLDGLLDAADAAPLRTLITSQTVVVQTHYNRAVALQNALE
jgi:predicted outer membrane protein